MYKVLAWESSGAHAAPVHALQKVSALTVKQKVKLETGGLPTSLPTMPEEGIAGLILPMYRPRLALHVMVKCLWMPK